MSWIRLSTTRLGANPKNGMNPYNTSLQWSCWEVKPNWGCVANNLYYLLSWLVALLRAPLGLVCACWCWLAYGKYSPQCNVSIGICLELRCPLCRSWSNVTLDRHCFAHPLVWPIFIRDNYNCLELTSTVRSWSSVRVNCPLSGLFSLCMRGIIYIHISHNTLSSPKACW